MPFFDFHCHPGLKPQFSDPAKKPSPWQYINAKLRIVKDIKLRINALFNEVLNSQSSLEMLAQNDVKLIGLVLHAPEKKVGVGLGEKKIVNTGAVELIDVKQLKYIAAGTHSFELINEELNWLLTAPPSLPGKKLKILQRAADFEETDGSHVFAAIIVEGLHCFHGDPDAPDAKEAFNNNFNSFTSRYPVIAVNVCHMQQNKFCNHAYGMQFLKPGYFYPEQSGITNWGKDVIQQMIDKKILTDIKHMSLKARWELYSWFQDADDETKFIQPLVCTHAGTTGLSIAHKAEYLLQEITDKGTVYEVVHAKPRSRHFDDVYHNCSSINLYDEDIEKILLSGGIIGMSFDQRILGFADENVIAELNTPHDAEYISHAEAGFFLGPRPLDIPVRPADETTWAAEDFAELSPADFPFAHCRFLVNNIIHILWVAGRHDKIGFAKAARQICLGTDFDGLINAIDCCKTTADLASFKQRMKADLVEGLQKIGAGSLDAGELLENIFYRNGRDFMLGRLRALRGG